MMFTEKGSKGIQKKVLILSLSWLMLVLAAPSAGYAQQLLPFDRLSSELLDIPAPSERVSGNPGNMRIELTSCKTLPSEVVRRRIVNAATQEWAFFGFSIMDQSIVLPRVDRPRRGPRRIHLSAEETARVANSVGGYWSATAQGSWILERQNDSWNDDPLGLAGGWRDAWSAAFISWVMCEGGLGNSEKFNRAIAHHTYIDQAIRARDGNDPLAAFVAYDMGEAPIVPGDLLCNGLRPRYQELDERRQQMGEGARTHCDIVVKVDEKEQRILAIGGNVRGSVRMKLLPATHAKGEHLSPAYDGRRATFAHLKLNTDPIEADAVDHSPTMQAASCNRPLNSVPLLAANLAVASARQC
jgi:hypothetical protein